ncbi:MAG: UbiA prenyltransferase family protein [Clostridia bacterium]|nr:UbiA prenyltransferase family protein [Clostridia bacterium]
MKKYIKLIRVKHWIKNELIFLPLFCSFTFSKESIISTILAFFAFSFMASFIYIINDIRDVEKDRNHPRKKNRPIASGAISVKKAIFVAAILIIASFGTNFLATKTLLNPALGFLLAYLIVNICYSFGMKNIPIVDVALLTAGFVIRVYYGAAIISVPVSTWLFLTILNASLYLGLGKRKKELKIKDEVRPVLKNYNENFINNFMNICLTLVIVFYSLWTMEQTNTILYLSVPLLIVLFMQYMLFMETSDEGDPITLLFQHKSLMITALIYALFMIVVMIVLRFEY